MTRRVFHHISSGLLAILAALSLAQTALADVAPSVEIRLASPFVAVKAGEVYDGRYEIVCAEDGTLADFALAGASWSASLTDAPRSRDVRAGDRFVVPFTATPMDPTQKLEFTCSFNGYTVHYAIDLSERNVHDMTEGAPTAPVPAFLDGRGDPSYRDEDLVLGGPGPEPPRDSRRTVTVTGRFGCTLDDGTYLPGHSVLVQVYDEDSLVDDLLVSGYTNYDGYYTLAFNSDDAGWLDEPDVYVRFTTSNGRMRVYEPSSGDNYAFVTGVTNDYTGTYLDYGSLQPANPDLHPCVFLHTQGSRGWVHDNNLGYDVPAARVEWPSAAWPNTSGDGRIQIRSDFSWNDGTLWHEYGHWFDHEMASWEPFNYCNGVCDNPPDCGHCFWCQESQAIAWLEGWAQFHSWAVGSWYPGYYGRSPLSAVNAENLGTCSGTYGDPTLTEGFIAALTQDIADNAQDSHGVYGTYTDRLAVGVDDVFNLNALDNPTGSMDFISKYIARYVSQRELFWETAANCGYDLDATAPGLVANLHSTDHTAGLESPDPTVSMAWTRASDNLSGIAGYGLFVAVGGPGLPSAVQDIGDVTSYTTDPLPPGTYYFCIRSVDNAGNWSASYASWGPIVIREPDPADLIPYLPTGWDYPLVPRDANDATISSAEVSATLPGGAASTYWNIFGQNQGEASTGVGFYAWLNVDGENEASVYWNAVGAGGLYYGPNRGPLTVQAGRHSFTCRHDATDVVAEIDETNNVFGRQFIWTTPTISPGALVTRPAPPATNGGWSDVTSGSLYYNCDGVSVSTTTGWWHAVAVWADSDSDDFDCRLHTTSTGAETGFGASLGYSTNVYGQLDGVIANRNQVSDTSWDVGVLRWSGEGTYKAYHAYSQILTFGDSVTVAMPTNVPILLREFFVSTDVIGPVSVTAQCDPADGPMRLALLNSTFTTGSLTSGDQLGTQWTDGDGFARVSSDIATTGWYGIVVYRDQAGGLPATNVTIEVSTTPPDLAPWTPSGWYAGLVPRSALDGTSTSCPLPDTLYSTPQYSYLNVAATNLGPVPSTLPTHLYRDDAYLGYVSWGELPAGGQVSYNWNHQFAFSPGRHILALRVDGGNEIEETNETNNIRGEHWIWSPYAMTPPATAARPAPPERTAGWDDVTIPESLYYNCDGLRLAGTGVGYWKSVAILPAAGSDFDLRLHTKGTGTKDGFSGALAGSFLAGTVTEYMLVDYNSTAFADYDVGVLRWSGSGTYKAQTSASQYLGDAPVGTWGPYTIASGGLTQLIEFRFPVDAYQITVDNLSGADLAIAMHKSGVVYQNRLDAFAEATDAVAGADQSMTVSVSEQAYYCLVIYRQDQGGGAASFNLTISSGLTPVEDGLPALANRLAGASPNPFNPRTTLAYEVARSTHVSLAIYDLNGRRVRTLVDRPLAAGRYEATWDGTDDRGGRLASGMYVAQYRASGQVQTRKLTLVK